MGQKQEESGLYSMAETKLMKFGVKWLAEHKCDLSFAFYVTHRDVKRRIHYGPNFLYIFSLFLVNLLHFHQHIKASMAFSWQDMCSRPSFCPCPLSLKTTGSGAGIGFHVSLNFLIWSQRLSVLHGKNHRCNLNVIWYYLCPICSEV